MIVTPGPAPTDHQALKPANRAVEAPAPLTPEERRHESDLGQQMLRAPDGHLVPLKRVASVTRETGQPEIDRENLARSGPGAGR